MKRALPIAAAILLPALLSYGLSRVERSVTAHAPSPSAVPPPATTAPSTPTEPVNPELAQIDIRMAGHRAMAEARDDDWLHWEFVAIDAIDRARITGDYADYAVADRALEAGFHHALPGSGPFLTRAMLNSAMHRIDRVEPDLAIAERALMLSSGDEDAILSLRADARFYGGQYDEARTFYTQRLASTHRSAAALVALAQLEWRTGGFETATRLLDEAAAHRSVTAEGGEGMRAWVLSARAMMERDRGRLEDALTAIRTARGLTPNDPHLQQIFAEILELRGNDDTALELFRSVATTGSPQAMDGAARILLGRGDTIAADELVSAARQSYDAQIALFPEAAYGHAIDHWLRLEAGDVDRMIEIAEGNAEARPYGETQVKLAMAYLLAGRESDARRVLDEVLATAWQTFELHGVNAIALEREGVDGSAERAAAEAIAPGAMARLAWLADAPSIQ